MRLMLNQIVRRLTEKLAYKDGRPVSPHRRPLLLMLDEFTLFGRFEEFAESMNHIAGFGLRACLAVQSLNQIHEFYGPNQSIVDNCDTTVRFTPNSLKSAEEISRLVGQTSVRHAHRTQSGGGASVSEPEVGRLLMTPDEARRMSVNEVLIFARGQRPIRALLLKYHKAPYFRRLAAIKPPVTGDRTITAPSVTDERKKVERATSIDGAGTAAHKEPPRNEATPIGNGAVDANRDGGNRKLRFLKLATDGPKPTPEAQQ